MRTPLIKQWTVISFALALGLLTACGAQTEKLGGESHFLSACVADCTNDFECLVGVCTAVCTNHDDCSAFGPQAWCAMSGAISVCDKLCHDNVDCGALGSDMVCQDRHCRALPTGMCNDGGETHSNGDQWWCSDSCNRCTCVDGKIEQQAVECEPTCVRNGRGYALGQPVPCDECSCVCESTGVVQLISSCPGACDDQGETHEAGEYWLCDEGCSACFCETERVSKLTLSCTP